MKKNAYSINSLLIVSSAYLAAQMLADITKIGRASCRERV